MKSCNLPGFLSEYFLRNNCNHRSESDQLVSNFNTVFKGQNSISYFGSVMRNSLPAELRKTSSYQIFKSEIKKMEIHKSLFQIMQKLQRKLQYIFLLRYMCILFHNWF